MQRFKRYQKSRFFRYPTGFLFGLILFFFLLSPSWAQKVNVLVVAIHGIESCKSEWQPTIDYLKDSLPDHDFELIPVTPINLSHMEQLIRDQKIDFVITQPAIYVDLELKFGISRILTMVKKGGYAEFGSSLIVRSNSEIQTIDDLHNKVIAGVAKLGFGGWLIGFKEMMDQGFDPFEYAKEVKFLGNQPREVQAVLDGTVDAAVIRTGVLEKLSASKQINMDDFRVLAPKTHPGFSLKVSTPLYPEWAFAKTHKASDDLSKAVALALLGLGSNSPIAKKAGFQEWTFPYDYQPVHDLLKTLRVGPYKDFGKVSVLGFIGQHKIESITFLLLVLIILLMTAVIYRSNRILFKEKAEKEKAFEEMRHMATHDYLTGLPNRKLFMEFLGKMLNDAKRRKSNMAIMFIDLDCFKEINDRFGHESGDDVLCQVATMLSNTFRLNDIVARIGGDEFVVALSNVGGEKGVVALAERLIQRIPEINLPKVKDAGFGASIGIAFGIPDKQQDAEELIKLSDHLMYKAKNSGKGNYILAPIQTGSNMADYRSEQVESETKNFAGDSAF